MAKKWFDKEIFSDLEDELEKNKTFKNTVKLDIENDGKNEASNSCLSDDEFDDENDHKYDIKKPLTDMEKRRKRLKRQRIRQEKKEEANTKDQKIQIVPQINYEDYDIDDLANTMVLAKKMLRTKNRDEIIESSYSRYAFHDDENLPDWFVEDEKIHNFINLPITKEESQMEKKRLMAINARLPKKVIFLFILLRSVKIPF